MSTNADSIKALNQKAEEAKAKIVEAGLGQELIAVLASYKARYQWLSDNLASVLASQKNSHFRTKILFFMYDLVQGNPGLTYERLKEIARSELNLTPKDISDSTLVRIARRAKSSKLKTHSTLVIMTTKAD